MKYDQSFFDNFDFEKDVPVDLIECINNSIENQEQFDRNKKPTSRQIEIMDFVKFNTVNKISPSLVDVANHFGFSVQAASQSLLSCIKNGYINKTSKHNSYNFLGCKKYK